MNFVEYVEPETEEQLLNFAKTEEQILNFLGILMNGCNIVYVSGIVTLYPRTYGMMRFLKEKNSQLVFSLWIRQCSDDYELFYRPAQLNRRHIADVLRAVRLLEDVSDEKKLEDFRRKVTEEEEDLGWRGGNWEGLKSWRFD